MTGDEGEVKVVHLDDDFYDDHYRCAFQGRCTDPTCSLVHRCGRFYRHREIHPNDAGHQRYGIFDPPPEGWMNRSTADNALHAAS